jgi:hypothetical protein
VPAGTGTPVSTGSTATPLDFHPLHTWTWEESQSNGYKYSGKLSVGTIEHVQEVPAMLGPSSVSTIESQCPNFSSETDAVIPAEVQMTNNTVGFSLNVVEQFYLADDENALYPNLMAISSGFACAPIATFGNEAANGGDQTGPWQVTSGGLAPGAKSAVIPAFFVVGGYYSPDHPNGDQPVLDQAVLTFWPASGTSFTAWSGPGDPSVNGIPLDGEASPPVTTPSINTGGV